MPTAFRVLARIAPTAIAAAAAAAAAEWASWVRPAAVYDLAAAPAAGVVLAVLVLLAPRRWPVPLVAATSAIAGIELAHGSSTVVAVGTACAVAVGALTAAALLRWYANGWLTLARVRELVALGCAAAVGAVITGMVGAATAAAGDLHTELWRAAYRHGLAAGFGMVIVTSVALTWNLGPVPGRRAPGRVETTAFAVALAAGAVGFAVWSDPLGATAVLVLVWSGLRFAPRFVAGASIAFVAVADWAVARHTGIFPSSSYAPDAVLLLQIAIAVTVVTSLGLALARRERDEAGVRRWNADERFRRAFNDAPIGMAITALDGTIVEANRALCDMLQYREPQLVGRSLRALRPEDSGEHELRPWPNGPDAREQREQRLVAADGEIIWVELSDTRLRRRDGAPEQTLVVVHDVTERKALQQQLVHAQKMESVGRLAGGIAHDFNNVLAIMRGQVELLQDDLVVLEQARARIESVQRATDRAAVLTEDLMAFSRRRVDEPVVFDLNEMVSSSRELLHQMLGATVALELSLDANPAMIFADPHRIEQALFNLAVNARDAMPSGGRLTIATGNSMAPDHSVALTVTDTGVGIDAATLARVFEPFFTTKPPGMGTGLGLSTTEEIVRSAGGTIDVHSDRGKGTRFTISFPALAPRADDFVLVEHLDGDTAVVLVVDDNAEVRALVTETLRAAGYGVVAATDGDAAMKLLDRATRPVSLLVTDVVMPVMSGTDLAARVVERSPDTRVLFVSGFVPAGSPALRGAPLLTKPLRRADLLDAVRAVLGRDASAVD